MQGERGKVRFNFGKVETNVEAAKRLGEGGRQRAWASKL